jgi:hypothetical protein
MPTGVIGLLAWRKRGCKEVVGTNPQGSRVESRASAFMSPWIGSRRARKVRGDRSRKGKETDKGWGGGQERV